MYIYPTEIPDAVRRQLFWIIKRHTSYTAWARAFAAYDQMFRKMESLLPELASKPLGTYGLGLYPHTKPFRVWPNWQGKQLFYQKYAEALARLGKGDKSSWGERASGPVLREVPRYAENLLCFFLGEDPRERYDKDRDPIIPEKRALIMLAWEAYNRAYENVELSETHSPPYGVYVKLNYSAEFNTLTTFLPDKPGQYSFNHRDIISLYPIPADLPPVPEPVMLPSQAPPWWAPKKHKGGPLVFRSGERVFMPGIYLSDPYDMLHYIHQESPAPVLDLGAVDGQRRDLDCAWTLIWPDERYNDEADIPAEEALYFPDDQKPQEPEGSRAYPGQPCPRTGVWNAPNLPGVHKYIRWGEPMPGPEMSEFGTVIWHWLQEEPYPDKRRSH